MADLLEIHPGNPQTRLLRRVVSALQNGGIIAYPTDATYALGCHIGDKSAQKRLRSIRQLDEHHELSLVCAHLSQVATYAKVSNPAFRFMKAHTPGPYTFILPATREVLRQVQDRKRKAIGIRIPDHEIIQYLLSELDEPLLSTTLQLPGDDLPLTDTYEIEQRIGKQIDMIISSGDAGIEPTTVIDLQTDEPKLLRAGKGETPELI